MLLNISKLYGLFTTIVTEFFVILKYSSTVNQALSFSGCPNIASNMFLQFLYSYLKIGLSSSTVFIMNILSKRNTTYLIQNSKFMITRVESFDGELNICHLC